MAQTGFTPLQIYSSSTAAAAPADGNLINSTLGSELAINITDGKLFYKDNANAVQVIGWKVVPTTAGGTGLTSYAAGDLLYYATGTTLAKLTIGTSTTVLTSSGSAPQWTAQSSLSVGSATNVTGGAQGSIPYQSGASTTVFLAKNTTATRYLANTGTNNDPAWAQINLSNGVTGTLPTTNGGTGQSAFGGNRVLFTTAGGQFSDSANLTYDGSKFTVDAKSSYLDPTFTSTGGFNIFASYSYNDGNANTIGGASALNSMHNIIYIASNAGITAIPLYPNGGAGVAWAWNYLDPDAGTWAYSAASPTITFTQNGTGGNTFAIVLNSNTGAGTIQRTAGSLAYSVYVQRLGK
jgi:hypothetical protein